VNLLNVLLLLVWFEPIRERFAFSNLYAVHLDDAWIEGKVLKRMLNLLNVPPRLGNSINSLLKGRAEVVLFCKVVFVQS
jgi:hypothetical protein